MENMNTVSNIPTKAVIIGSACIVFSSLSPDEIRRFKSYHPEALQLHDEETDKVVFTIDIDEEGPGSLTTDGAVYSKATSAEGKATMTILLDPSADDRLDLAEKNLGGPLLRLIEMEKQLVEKLPELEEEKQQVLANISLL